MSIELIRDALEQSLNGMTPALATAWENQPFTPPVASAPYQECFIKFARPDNQTRDGHQELGYMQVNLRYPEGTGTKPAAARAALLRTTFRRKSTHVSGAVSVVISDTPEVTDGPTEKGRYTVIVKVRFFANIN